MQKTIKIHSKLSIHPIYYAYLFPMEACKTLYIYIPDQHPPAQCLLLLVCFTLWVQSTMSRLTSWNAHRSEYLLDKHRALYTHQALYDCIFMDECYQPPLSLDKFDFDRTLSLSKRTRPDHFKLQSLAAPFRLDLRAVIALLGSLIYTTLVLMTITAGKLGLNVSSKLFRLLSPKKLILVRYKA